MLDVANANEVTNAGIGVVQPLPDGKVGLLSEQEGLYTTVVKGFENDEPRTEYRIVTAVQDWVYAYEEWDRFLKLSRIETVRWLVPIQARRASRMSIVISRTVNVQVHFQPS